MKTVLIDLSAEVADSQALPSSDDFSLWVNTAIQAEPIKALPQQPELSIRLVDDEESQALNKQYRHKDKPTNVLSFPAEFPEGVDVPLLGDLVICAPVVSREALEQNKQALSHWAHMTIHGTLHLMGYDHINDTDAALMEATETQLLQSLGYAKPYST
ncbi:MAG: rRNA maturation RNase YbeY [Cellvibrionaceae bacterium]